MSQSNKEESAIDMMSRYLRDEEDIKIDAGHLKSNPSYLQQLFTYGDSPMEVRLLSFIKKQIETDTKNGTTQPESDSFTAHFFLSDLYHALVLLHEFTPNQTTQICIESIKTIQKHLSSSIPTGAIP